MENSSKSNIEFPGDFIQHEELLKKSYFVDLESLENKIESLKEQVESITNQLNDCNKVISNTSTEIKTLMQKNSEKEKENQRLAGDIRRIKIENARLSDFKSYLFNSVDLSTSQNSPQKYKKNYTEIKDVEEDNKEQIIIESPYK